MVKNIFILLTVFILAAPLSALAGTLYINRDAQAGEAAQQQSPPVPQQVPQQTPPTAPPPQTIQDFSKRYYDNCMAKKDDVLKGDMQKSLCACSAEKLAQEMTVDDVRTMTMETPEGQAQRNRMLIKVYAPCMRFPARALIYESCITGPDVKSKVPNYEAVCGCMADGMSQYVAENGPAVIEKSLMENPNDLNPLQSLMNSPDFQAQSQTRLMACLVGKQ